MPRIIAGHESNFLFATRMKTLAYPCLSKRRKVHSDSYSLLPLPGSEPSANGILTASAVEHGFCGPPSRCTPPPGLMRIKRFRRIGVAP
jgi:hypothetical protein